MDGAAHTGPALEIATMLDPDELAGVSAVVERATEADGVRPLSEHVSLHLRYGGDRGGRHVLAYLPSGAGDSQLVGYAHLDVSDAVQGASGEVVVDPAARGQGVGRALVAQLLSEVEDGRLRLWSHGGLPAAGALAASLGLSRVRELWQMRRSLYAPVPPPRWPAGVTVRTFRVGRDEQAWLALNARAFADHPEQGSWTMSDLTHRLGEPWFDAEGFFLAERGGELVGFHWTKVHGASEPGVDGHAHTPMGEVYVVGVDPDQRGTGLGRALTLEGLVHLRGRGLDQAMLYVDADNTAAIALYESLAFTRWDTDVMFAR